MSKIRPELITSKGDRPCPSYETGLYMVRDAVRRRDELIAGRLDGMNDTHCAIGSYFADNPKTALPTELIDEVALYNDSVKTSSPRIRRAKVLQWLNWKLAVLAGRGKKGARPYA